MIVNGARALLGEIYRFAPRLSLKVIFFIIIGGVLEGASVLLFLPFFAAFSATSSNLGLLPASVTAWVPTGMSATQLLLATCAIFLLIMILKALVVKTRDQLNFSLAVSFSDHLRVKLIHRLANAPWSRLDRIKQADIENVVVSETERIKSAAMLFGFSMVDLALAVSHGVIIIFLSPVLGIACLGLILLVGGYLRSTMKTAKFLGKNATYTTRDIHKTTTDLLQNLKTAKGQNLERRYVQFFQDTVLASQDTQNKFKLYELRNSVILQISMAAVAVLILLFGILVLQNDIATVLLIVLALGRLVPTVFRINRNTQFFSHMMPAYENIQALLRQFPEREAHASAALQPKDGAPLVALKDVSFGFGTEPDILEHANFEAKQGEFIAIIGPSGTGKSTLLDLILGLYQPNSGQIYHGGHASTAPIASAFRDRAAYLPQETFLHNLTIRENLQWAAPDASEKDMKTALMHAGAAEFVAAFELGQDTLVGDRGTRLSGGERQRISLAQALLRQPEILLLDEALGANSEAVLRPLLQSLRSFNPKMTLVYVTHRLSDLAEMDRVLTLKDGALRARGILGTQGISGKRVT